MKKIIADEIIEKLRAAPLSEWVMQLIEKIIDEMPSADEPRKVVWQSLVPLNPRSKKNNQKIVYNKRTHKRKITQGDIYKQYENECGWFLKPPAKPIDYPVNIRCVFYRETAHRCDLTNLLEAIDDILVKYKVITDDNFKILVGHDGSRVYVDRENPRTEITIERV